MVQLEVVTREVSGTPRETPLLFVHGMWHAAWCWAEHALPFFAEHGFKTYAVSLRGHGASEGRDRLRWTPLAAYVADVEQVVKGLESPPVLIGNSMGGMVVQKYLESRPAPAAALVASVPPQGAIPATLRVARRRPIPFLKANLTLSMLPVVSTPELYREAFYSAHLPEQELRRYHAQVQDESYRAYVDMLGLNRVRPKKVRTPLLVLGASGDQLVSPGEVKATAKAYRTQAEIFPELGHGMLLDHGWQAPAQRILGWLNERGF